MACLVSKVVQQWMEISGQDRRATQILKRVTRIFTTPRRTSLTHSSHFSPSAMYSSFHSYLRRWLKFRNIDNAELRKSWLRPYWAPSTSSMSPPKSTMLLTCPPFRRAYQVHFPTTVKFFDSLLKNLNIYSLNDFPLFMAHIITQWISQVGGRTVTKLVTSTLWTKEITMCSRRSDHILVLLLLSPLLFIF